LKRIDVGITDWLPWLFFYYRGWLISLPGLSIKACSFVVYSLPTCCFYHSFLSYHSFVEVSPSRVRLTLAALNPLNSFTTLNFLYSLSQNSDFSTMRLLTIIGMALATASFATARVAQIDERQLVSPPSWR
jgi:hypothetical protein